MMRSLLCVGAEFTDRDALESSRSESAIVLTMIAPTTTAFAVDHYLVDVLLRDLVGHDRSPAAFLVYLLLWRHTRGLAAASVRLSHRDIAEDTGLSKSAVQQALRILHRRGLVRSKQQHQTDTPEHCVLRTWTTRGSPASLTIKPPKRSGKI